MFEQVLVRLLTMYHQEFTNIRWVQYDPYNECKPKRYDIDSK